MKNKSSLSYSHGGQPHKLHASKLSDLGASVTSLSSGSEKMPVLHRETSPESIFSERSIGILVYKSLS